MAFGEAHVVSDWRRPTQRRQPPSRHHATDKGVSSSTEASSSTSCTASWTLSRGMLTATAQKKMARLNTAMTSRSYQLGRFLVEVRVMPNTLGGEPLYCPCQEMIARPSSQGMIQLAARQSMIVRRSGGK